MAVTSDTVVIGAGPAGMACAWELVRAGRRVLVLEREDRAGGLARTVDFDLPGVGRFRSDIGPHRFFSRNPYLYRLIEDVLGERWSLVERHTRFHIDGRFYHYPPRVADVLRGMGTWQSTRCLLDIAVERLKDPFRRGPPENFRDYVVRQFGRTLAEFNMLNYTEKVWGIPCSEISPDWAGQRIEGLTVAALLRKILAGLRSRGADGGAKSLVDSFYYPDSGAGLTYEAMRKRVEESGLGEVRLGCTVETVMREGDRVTGVVCRRDGQRETLTADHVVSTMLLTDLVHGLDPVPPADIVAANDTLRHRSQVYVFLMLDRDRVGPDNWVYFPDHDVPFGRIYEPKSFSAGMAPKGKTGLWIEHFVFEGDDVWRADPEALARQDLDWLVKLGFLDSADEMLDFRHHRERNVYPIYDIGYRERLEPVMEWMAGLRNLYLAGRGARFRYTNQDHSLEMGILAAQSILRGERLNIEDVASEQSYFEAGYVPMRAATRGDGP